MGPEPSSEGRDKPISERTVASVEEIRSSLMTRAFNGNSRFSPDEMNALIVDRLKACELPPEHQHILEQIRLYNQLGGATRGFYMLASRPSPFALQ